MSTFSINTYPYLLGFEAVEQLLERNIKGQNSYPPFNVEILAENRYRVTLALAGFSEEQLEIRIENNHLIIEGQQVPYEAERVFLHQGIATRKFQKKFLLAEGVEVKKALFENGLLHIDMERNIPHSTYKNIPIAKK